MPKPMTITDDDGNEIEIPTRWEICDDCNGEGTRALHGEAITSSEWADWDDDEREGYMRGDYDTPCSCSGGKVRVPDYDALSADERAVVDAHEKFEAEQATQEAYQRRYGF